SHRVSTKLSCGATKEGTCSCSKTKPRCRNSRHSFKHLRADLRSTGTTPESATAGRQAALGRHRGDATCPDLVSCPGRPRSALADGYRERAAPCRAGKPGLPPVTSESRPGSRRCPRKHRLQTETGPATAGRTVLRRGSR